MFGVTSAPEKYQQIVRDALRGCPGVANIADNLIIHGKGVEEHGRCLLAVLDRLSEVGLTENGEKCEFRLSKLTFFGHELTSDGVNPSEEKVADIRDARPPKDASEGMIFYGSASVFSKVHARCSFHNQAHSRVDQEGCYLQVGHRTTDSF